MSDATFGPEWSASLRRGTDAELRSWLEIAKAACDETDEIARRYFRRDLTIDTKPDRTFVTVADTEVETRLRERIGAAFPDHGIIGEEFGTEGADASVRWYLDPIDGTHNFIRGVPIFATLIAVDTPEMWRRMADAEIALRARIKVPPSARSGAAEP